MCTWDLFQWISGLSNKASGKPHMSWHNTVVACRFDNVDLVRSMHTAQPWTNTWLSILIDPKQLLCRLTESECTLEKRLAWASQQVAAAAAPGLFDATVEDSSPEAAYQALQHAVAPLSPAVRNKLQGLPADVLDYADLIASSSVAQPILKPVLLAGKM